MVAKFSKDVGDGIFYEACILDSFVFKNGKKMQRIVPYILNDPRIIIIIFSGALDFEPIILLSDLCLLHSPRSMAYCLSYAGYLDMNKNVNRC